MRGTVRRRGNSWTLQVYAGKDPVTGKERRVTKTVRAPATKAGRKIADEELARLILEVSARGTKVNDDVTVAELLEKWIRWNERSWSVGHLRQTRHVVEKRIVPRIGAMRADRVRPAHLNGLYAELRERGGKDGGPLSEATLLKVHNTLSGAFKAAVKADLLATNPATNAQRPSPETKEIIPPPAEPLLQAFELAQGDPAFYAFLLTAATTGKRLGQLVALTWERVDADSALFSRALADGGPGKGIIEKGTKTGVANRTALDEATSAALSAWRRVHVADCLARGVPAEGYVFRHPDGRPWRPDGASKRWLKLRRQVPGLEDVNFHQLRHFVATELYAAGLDPVEVAHRLDHASPAMSMQRYASFRPERDRQAAEVMGRVLKSS